MRILEYHDLETKGVEKAYQKVKAMLEQGDFYSAEVKKLNPTPYYRAKLDYTNRLLFRVVTYKEQKHLLLLEIIHQHAYEKSKFLSGAKIDESKVIHHPEVLESEAISYIHPSSKTFHLLDKVISFDENQQKILQLPLPLVVIGSAGSGKTALMLEKMKQCTGEILYITNSPYLVQHAHKLYYANAYSNPHQNIDFLSYKEFIETFGVPNEPEIVFTEFARWLTRLKPQKILKNPHKLYEEFKGVITGFGAQSAFLSKEEYLDLGIKQSIYLSEERESVYNIFTQYLALCQSGKYYDLNLLSHKYLNLCSAKYDYVVIDEMQDFTSIQLILIHKSLKQPKNFLLCGDSNQIVHPNFFSWSKIKSLFYQGDLGETAQQLKILFTNYRNSQAVTDLANQILKIKTKSLGSVDRESHYLVESHSEKKGSVFFFQLEDANTRELNQKTQHSKNFAVIVLRDEWKEAAKKYFQTPLVFSIYEAKGLEYEHIILFNFVSAETKAFREMIQNVTLKDLEDDFTYGRSKDKTKKALETYKFYINALYVAITRSMQNVYWVESEVNHELFNLLKLEQYREALTLQAEKSSTAEWQQEARKLELQGKKEQADAIRNSLKQTQVPWEIITQEKAAELQQNMLTKKSSKIEKIQLLEYALIYHREDLIQQLAKQGLGAAHKVQKSQQVVWDKYYYPYAKSNLSVAQDQIQKYGPDFRNTFNQTILMIATLVGNVQLIDWLLASGANPDLTDNAENTAFDLMIQKACLDKRFSQNHFAENYKKIAPSHFSLQAENKLIKLDQQHAEFLLVSIGLALERLSLSKEKSRLLSTQDFVNAVKHLPESICPDYRKKRAYISALLAKNEIHSKNPYNRFLFSRIKIGKYRLNPNLKIKKGEQWHNLISSQNSTTDHWAENILTNLKLESTWCPQVELQMRKSLSDVLATWPPKLHCDFQAAYQRENTLKLEVTLRVTIHARAPEPIFSIHMVQMGIFTLDTPYTTLAEEYCKHQLSPYVVTEVNTLLGQSGLPPIFTVDHLESMGS